VHPGPGACHRIGIGIGTGIGIGIGRMITIPLALGHELQRPVHIMIPAIPAIMLQHEIPIIGIVHESIHVLIVPDLKDIVVRIAIILAIAIAIRSVQFGFEFLGVACVRHTLGFDERLVLILMLMLVLFGIGIGIVFDGMESQLRQSGNIILVMVMIIMINASLVIVNMCVQMGSINSTKAPFFRIPVLSQFIKAGSEEFIDVMSMRGEANVVWIYC
jgi:hypothetical protein